jgi:dsDNA-specific endonuclease/ATPase MutS2
MVFMDKSTKESLDFQYILNNISPITPYGIMYKSRMDAFTLGKEKELKEELDKLESFLPHIENSEIRREFNNIFAHIKDLRTSIKRTMDGFILTEVELFEIKNFLLLLRNLNNLIVSHKIPVYEDTEIIPIESLEILLDPENTEISTFYIYDAYSELLKETRQKRMEADKDIKLHKKNIKEQIKKDLNLDLRPDGSIAISKDDKDLLKKLEDYPYLSYVSESYMNIKFSIKPTEKIVELERLVTIFRDKEEKEEQEIREKLSKEIGKKRKEIFRNMANIGRLDLIIAKSKYSLEIQGIKPEIIEEHRVKITDGVHPKVRDFLKDKKLKFTPISIELQDGVTCITGANMGGKSISLKLVGLLSAMAQYGLFVPAKSMEIGLNKYIKSSIGDMQSTDSGLSTFGGEVKIVSEAIARADERGLILIDELARGTNPEEGYAISKAVVTYLKDRKSISLLTTHYDNIANAEDVVHLQVIGLSKINILDLFEEVHVDEKMDFINKYMDYRLKPVDNLQGVPRDALNIATIMGLDKRILALAESYLDNNKKE